MAILQYLLHVPWPIAALIAVAGMGLFFMANRRQDTTLQRLSVAAVADHRDGRSLAGASRPPGINLRPILSTSVWRDLTERH